MAWQWVENCWIIDFGRSVPLSTMEIPVFLAENAILWLWSAARRNRFIFWQTDRATLYNFTPNPGWNEPFRASAKVKLISCEYRATLAPVFHLAFYVLPRETPCLSLLKCLWARRAPPVANHPDVASTAVVCDSRLWEFTCEKLGGRKIWLLPFVISHWQFKRHPRPSPPTQYCQYAISNLTMLTDNKRLMKAVIPLHDA